MSEPREIRPNQQDSGNNSTNGAGETGAIQIINGPNKQQQPKYANSFEHNWAPSHQQQIPMYGMAGGQQDYQQTMQTHYYQPLAGHYGPLGQGYDGGSGGWGLFPTNTYQPQHHPLNSPPATQQTQHHASAAQQQPQYPPAQDFPGSYGLQPAYSAFPDYNTGGWGSLVAPDGHARGPRGAGDYYGGATAAGAGAPGGAGGGGAFRLDSAGFGGAPTMRDLEHGMGQIGLGAVSPDLSMAGHGGAHHQMGGFGPNAHHTGGHQMAPQSVMPAAANKPLSWADKVKAAPKETIVKPKRVPIGGVGARGRDGDLWTNTSGGSSAGGQSGVTASVTMGQQAVGANVGALRQAPAPMQQHQPQVVQRLGPTVAPPMPQMPQGAGQALITQWNGGGQQATHGGNGGHLAPSGNRMAPSNGLYQPQVGSMGGVMPHGMQHGSAAHAAGGEGDGPQVNGQSTGGGGNPAGAKTGGGGGAKASSAVEPTLDSSSAEISEHLRRLRKETNPTELVLPTKGARYFVIKSYSEDDVHRSIKYAIWCSTDHGNKRLDQAWREREGKGPILLFFSVNASGHFCGVAQMVSAVDYTKQSGVWAQDKWKGLFKVRWMYVKDVPNAQLRQIRLENNENKPVTNSRDTQEVPAEKGKQVLRIIHQFPHTTSLFDDFSHYEKRQQEEDQRKVVKNDS